MLSHVAPPSKPVPFEAKQEALARNPGRPLDTQTEAQLRTTWSRTRLSRSNLQRRLINPPARTCESGRFERDAGEAKNAPHPENVPSAGKYGVAAAQPNTPPRNVPRPPSATVHPGSRNSGNPRNAARTVLCRVHRNRCPSNDTARMLRNHVRHPTHLRTRRPAQPVNPNAVKGPAAPEPPTRSRVRQLRHRRRRRGLSIRARRKISPDRTWSNPLRRHSAPPQSRRPPHRQPSTTTQRETESPRPSKSEHKSEGR